MIRNKRMKTVALILFLFALNLLTAHLSLAETITPILLAQDVPTSTPTPAPNCTDIPPGSAPQLNSAITKGTTQVALSWSQASDPVTYYLIAYGTTSGKYLYGNVNVGGRDTTSYTVGHLSPRTIYYFVVRAGNGCQPGNFSSEIAATTGPFVTIIPTNTPTATPTPQNTPTPTPVVVQYQNYPQSANPTGIATGETSGLITHKAPPVDLWGILRTLLIILASISIILTTGAIVYFKFMNKTTIKPQDEIKKEEATQDLPTVKK